MRTTANNHTIGESKMNTKEHLLACLIEEAAEVQQAATKALRFGLADGYPGGDTTNAQDIEKEFIELLTVIDMCREYGVTCQPGESATLYADKKVRVKKYMLYAKEVGALED
jgi:hypothetical protein